MIAVWVPPAGERRVHKKIRRAQWGLVMVLKRLVLSAVLALGAVSQLSLATPASALTFRYAFQGDLNGLDPYTLNETFAQAALNNIYDGLTRRDENLKIVPCLAESWEVLNPLQWRFHLRHGVKFAGGEDFTADDVLFSAERVQQPGSQMTTKIPPGTKVVKVDDYTVDFILTTPNPILIAEWDNWMMMSKKWAEANGAEKPQAASGSQLNAFALKANGTGPFMVVSHEPGVKTVYKPNPNWWDKANKKFNFDEVVFTTIKSPATRVAALLTGEVDLIEPVPVQDMQRIADNPTTSVLTGPELRTVFLYMDEKRDELLYSSVKGKNPFKDLRVRKAFYEAIDIEAIKTKIMRGLATPSALLIAPSLYSRSGEFKRLPYDPADAKKLLAEAGYPDGFELTMHCPNDRYVNDEAICQAVTSMLAKIGIKATLNAMPKAVYFAKAGPAQHYDVSFGMLGWTPSGLDSWNVIANLAGCRDDNGVGGTFNYGGYCNPKVDELNKQILVETDIKKRDELIAQAYKIISDDVGLLPLHQQALAWGVSKKIKIPLRSDDEIMFYTATKQE